VTERLVLGIGNAERGDDAVGRVVADALRGSAPRNVRVLEQEGEATALVLALQSVDQAWLIDAARSGAPSGTIHRIDCANSDMAALGNSVSSHGFGLAEAIALARALGSLPEHCIIYAVEAADFAAGAPLSPAVAAAAREVTARILKDIASHA